MIVSVCDRWPEFSPADALAGLVVPAQFSQASFASYRPDPRHRSQAVACARVEKFSQAPRRGGWTRRWHASAASRTPAGLYLDGGYGVGKTHLLAAAWHAFDGVKTFGTFMEYTALVGALGFAGARDQLRRAGLICIDAFELDDPGDTMMIARLLSEVVEGGSRILASSNTPPRALGAGRFAARDFAREIQSLSAHFEIVTIDGEDFRMRHTTRFHDATSPRDADARISAWDAAGLTVAVDNFDALISHLGELHPARYPRVVQGIDAVAWHGLHPLDDHQDALRLVAFVDRLYDQDIRLVATGAALSDVFTSELRTSGFAKKYARALSRLGELSGLSDRS